jgi:type II secretory pathway pseudopilin PulG
MVSLSNTIRPKRNSRRGEQGYVLLTMLLAVSLLMIAATAAITPMAFELKREREEEMIHRGVQYTRAIRAYYKKFGRYPTRLEDLDNTNNLRYLRKHYKDPLNKNQDFKLLHFGDPDVKLSGTIGGGTIPGATPVGAQAGLNGTGSNGSSFGSSSFGSSSFGSSSGSSSFGNSSFGSSGVNSSGVFAQSSSFGGNSSFGVNSSFGGNSNNSNSGSTSSNSQGTSSPSTPDSSSGSEGSQSAQGANGTAQAASSSGQQPIASGPIVGVASLNKETTIREFNKKKKYNEWQFVYDPTADRGGLITTPYQPALQSFASNQLGQPGQNGTQGSTSSSPFGSSSGSGFGFGQSSFGQSSFGQSGSGNNSGGSSPQSTSNSPQ